MKSQNFSRLKGLAVSSTDHAKKAAGALALVGGVAAQAAPISTVLAVSHRGTRSSNLLYATWLGIGSGSAFANATVTTSNGRLISSGGGFGIGEGSMAGFSDAFDSVMHLSIDGVFFKNPGNTVDLSDGTLTTNVGSIRGIDTQIQYRFFANTGQAASDRAAVRALYTLTNATLANKTIDVLLGGNLGSDSTTTIHQTSNGDKISDVEDYWMYSNDNVIEYGEPIEDPGLIISKHGQYAAVVPTHALGLSPIIGGDNYAFRYNFTIAAGETIRILHFIEMVESNAIGLQQAAAYESLTTLTHAGLLDGMSQSEKDSLINYGNASTVKDTEKELGSINVLSVFSVIGLLLFRSFRRQA